ncbi:MAG: nucleoside hydrolase [Aerococcus sp.]|nr:nucleoside hydrolase [Aerococcus sp.]
MSKRPAIIDTDVAGDDAIAILTAMHYFDVKGITVCGGNVDFDQEVENALFTVDLYQPDHDVPVYKGAEKPLLKIGEEKHETVEYIFGPNGMGNVEMHPVDRQVHEGHAVDFIIDTAHELNGELELLAIAPLTNIALAFQKDPTILPLIKHLYIMGGANNTLGNATPAAEYNFYTDPEAAKLVLKSGVPMTMVDWRMCMDYGVMDEADEAEIVDTPNKGTKFYQDITALAKEHDMKVNGSAGITHTDSLMIAIAYDNSLMLECPEFYVDVETHGEITRGYSSVDRTNLLGQPANVRVCEVVDHERFKQMMHEVLHAIPD